MSIAPTIAGPGADREARPAGKAVFLAGALPGWALALLAGNLLAHELRVLWPLFVPLSTLAGGLAALGAWTWSAGRAEDGGRKKRMRALFAVFAVFASGVLLLLVLYARFVVRVDYAGTRSVAFLVSWSRSELCGCPPGDEDGLCIQSVGLDVGAVRSCWSHRWVIELALSLGYLLTLGSLGALAGLLTASGKAAAGAQGYLDFDLWIEQKSDSTFRAKAWSNAAGFEATVDFTLPPALAGGEPCRFGFTEASRGGPRSGEVGGNSPEEVGGELFRAVFHGDLLKSFQGCLDKAKDRSGLRIRLRLNDVPRLACLPWEYLYQARGRGFLALSARTPVIRYLELAEGLGTLLAEPPLRVLAVISTPRGYRELAEADAEWRQLGEVLAPLRDRGLIELERLERPTREALEERLRTGGPFHVLHFVGHGGWSELRGEGVLVFEDEAGDGAPMAGQSLAYVLRDHTSLRLAVLNACNGARASRDDAFAGTAQVLVQHGLPAVVAMQSEVTDATACRFAEELYRALAGGLPVDASIGEVRKALAAEANPEWGTPVLYLRATDGRLFDLNPC